MPTNVVKTPEDEKRWKRARDIASAAGKGDNYAYIMGIYQQMTKAGNAKALKKSRPSFKIEDSETVGGVRLLGKGESWAFVHRSSKNPGQWQTSFFESSTPRDAEIKDTQHKTIQDAVDEAIAKGYKFSQIIKSGTFLMKVMVGRIRGVAGSDTDDRISKADAGGHTYTRREGTKGNYKYFYDEMDAKKKDIGKKAEIKKLHTALLSGASRGVAQIMNVLAPGSGALVSGPLEGLYAAKTEKERQEHMDKLDEIREQVREKKKEEKEFAAKDRVRKMSDKELVARRDHMTNYPGLDTEAEDKQKDLMNAEIKRRGI